ncbi:MAG: carboxypeptidase-like regulatory domain-containing protein [Nannocystaceae bacterium]
MAEKRKHRFTLKVPIDASQVEDRGTSGAVKVVVDPGCDDLKSKIVEVDRQGQGVAEFAFATQPRALRVLVGPADATEKEMLGLQTLAQNVPAARWAEQSAIELPPIQIAPYYWYWWLRWCRDFKVTGRILCPDGSPVPGAQVCAYDVDWWWWWTSSQQLGCATTDASGAFEINFRWCCGWWSRWWWRNRFWQLEPKLILVFRPYAAIDSPEFGYGGRMGMGWHKSLKSWARSKTSVPTKTR